MPRASYYRARQSATRPATAAATDSNDGDPPHPDAQSAEGAAGVRTAPPPRRPHPRALSPVERAAVVAVLQRDDFLTVAPRAVYATLLDQGVYHCHWRTMYRILRAEQTVRMRRLQRRRPVYARPELLATAPNRLWSWDITKLRGPVAGQWFNLYVVLDVFSRKVINWVIAERETGAWAEHLITEAVWAEGVRPQQVVLHADRGAAMTAQVLIDALDDLGITRSHSRPSIANDNPFSEAQFKTMKYREDFPKRFGSLAEAEAWVGRFVTWYNTMHRHTGLRLLTPQQVHQGQATTVIAARQAVLHAAARAHPERFVRGVPQHPPLAAEVGINWPPTTPASRIALGEEPVPFAGGTRSLVANVSRKD